MSFDMPRVYDFSIAVVCPVCAQRVAVIEKFVGEDPTHQLIGDHYHEHGWRWPTKQARSAAIAKATARPVVVDRPFNNRRSRVVAEHGPVQGNPYDDEEPNP